MCDWPAPATTTHAVCEVVKLRELAPQWWHISPLNDFFYLMLIEKKKTELALLSLSGYWYCYSLK